MKNKENVNLIEMKGKNMITTIIIEIEIEVENGKRIQIIKIDSITIKEKIIIVNKKVEIEDQIIQNNYLFKLMQYGQQDLFPM